MKLPKSWRDVTVRQFADLYEIDSEKTPNDGNPAIENIAKSLRKLSVITGQSYQSLEDTPLNQVQSSLDAIAFTNILPPEKLIESFRINGVTWLVERDITKMNTGDYVTLNSLLANKDEVMNNINKILGSSWIKKRNLQKVNFSSFL